jgi:hypothetical protein
MADVLDAKVVTPDEADPAELAAAELVGFGSGVRNQRLYPELPAFVETLPTNSKGYAVTATFTCRGHDTWTPLKLIGGKHSGKPRPATKASAKNRAGVMA